MGQGQLSGIPNWIKKKIDKLSIYFNHGSSSNNDEFTFMECKGNNDSDIHRLQIDSFDGKASLYTSNDGGKNWEKDPIITQNTSLKMSTLFYSFAALQAVAGETIYEFDVSSFADKTVLAYIPVISYSGYIQMHARLRGGSTSSGKIQVTVVNGSGVTTGAYGGVNLHIFYV